MILSRFLALGAIDSRRGVCRSDDTHQYQTDGRDDGQQHQARDPEPDP
jgi:hypothetical protein